MKSKRWKIPITWKANMFVNAKNLTRAKEIVNSVNVQTLTFDDLVLRIDEVELAKSYPKETINESTNK